MKPERWKNPAKTISSIYKHFPDFVIEELGYIEQRELFNKVYSISNKVPVVIDSD